MIFYFATMISTSFGTTPKLDEIPSICSLFKFVLLVMRRLEIGSSTPHLLTSYAMMYVCMGHMLEWKASNHNLRTIYVICTTLR